MGIEPATPVLVGVGTVSQQLDEPGAGLDDSAMIIEAARRAVVDGGSRALQPRIGWIGATRGFAGIADVGRGVATELRVDAHTVAAAVGIPQQTLVNRAIEAIATGRVEAAIICGGEARHRADVCRRAGIALLGPALDSAEPDEVLIPSGELMARPEIEAGVVSPVQQYAMIDNARRARHGWSLEEHLVDIDGLWHGFNEVARTNPLAAFPQPLDPSEIRASGSGNRVLAFPYNRWHASQWSVDQSAALLLCSVEVATACGIPKDRWVFPHVGVDSSFSLSLSRRRDLDRWAAMRVLGEAAARHIGRAVDEIEHLELYSCFPSAVRVQQSELGVGHERVPTVTGGMSFAGGPFNNFVFQATAAMVGSLRADPGSYGMVTTVSGLLTKPALGVWSTSPPARAAMIADLVAEAAAATAEAPLNETPDGAGTVATYTVVPEGRDPARVSAIIDLDDGARAVATVEDDDLAAAAIVEDLIGRRVRVEGTQLHI